MWWLLLAPAAWLVHEIFKEEPPKEDSPPARTKTTLERNLERLSHELGACSGPKIAILGQPGAGKSSLLKKMTKGKVVPLPDIGTQTDATNWANDDGCNLLSYYKNTVFVDVPGYDTSSHPPPVFLSSFPFHSFDAFVLVIHGKLHSSDQDIFRRIVRTQKNYCVARSFADSLEKQERMLVQKDIRERLGLQALTEILFFSNRTGRGVGAVFTAVCS